VLHGSFARDDFSTTSDVDLLAVVRPGRPITRALYRECEEKARAWDGREVDLHFVHLPTADDRVSGSWAEAAVAAAGFWQARTRSDETFSRILN